MHPLYQTNREQIRGRRRLTGMLKDLRYAARALRRNPGFTLVVTREIGVRMALGARREEILRMVGWQGMRLAMAGIGAGLLGAAGLTRLMASLLYEVKPNDGATFAAAGPGMAAIAFAACCAPALRAARVDPAAALRSE